MVVVTHSKSEVEEANKTKSNKKLEEQELKIMETLGVIIKCNIIKSFYRS